MQLWLLLLFQKIDDIYYIKSFVTVLLHTFHPPPISFKQSGTNETKKSTIPLKYLLSQMSMVKTQDFPCYGQKYIFNMAPWNYC